MSGESSSSSKSSRAGSISSASESSTNFGDSENEFEDIANNVRQVAKPYVVRMRGLSEETQLILEEICRQRRLFEDRYDDFKLGLPLICKFSAMTRSHKIVIHRLPQRYRYSSMFTYLKGVRNVTKCLKEIRSLEDSYGRDLWILQFLALHNILVELDPNVASAILRSSILSVYLGCADAINKRSWHSISKQVSSIQFAFSRPFSAKRLKRKTDERKKYLYIELRTTSDPVNFYLTSLFLATVQRHLQLLESPEVTLGLIDESIQRFQVTCAHRLCLWTNPSSFFVLNGLIFKLCHGFNDVVSQIIETPLLQLEPNWQRAFFAYKHVNEYEMFCSNKSTIQAEHFLDLIESDFQSFKHKEQGLILMTIIIELCVYLNSGERLFEILSEICSKTPILFAHACRVLVANGVGSAPLSLFEDLVLNTELAHLDVTVDLLKEYSKEPEKHGPVIEVVRRNLKLAFSVLDYGRNKDNLDAWETLYENLKRVESDSALINEFWGSRRSWWPQFHALNEKDKCYKIKKKCFKHFGEVIV